jgi:hypothetical protein
MAHRQQGLAMKTLLPLALACLPHGVSAQESAALDDCEEATKRGVLVAPGGWIFTRRDYRSEFGLSDEAAAGLERLLAALQARGVQPALVMLPTRGMCHPGLEDLAAAHGLHFDLDAAQASYRQALAWFQGQGVLAPDLSQVAVSPELGGPYIFPSDHHWTTAGSGASAAALAALVKDHHVAERLPSVRYETRAADLPPRTWQGSLSSTYTAACPGQSVPDLSLARIETVRLDPVEYGLLDEVPPPPVVLVGTSNSDGWYNFGGYLAEALATDIFEVKKGGGGALAPMQTYLRSDEFIAHPPALLVWEWPTVDLWYDRPAAPPLWDQALYRQLVASVWGPCEAPLLEGSATLSPGEVPLLANPQGLPISGPGSYLSLQTSNRSLTAFEIISRFDDGSEERYPLETYGRAESNGRFFLELSAEHSGQLQSVSLLIPEGASGSIQAQVCAVPSTP